MGNESGEWIMHGLEWDNPACIHTVEKAIEHINDVGFLPLFKNEIEGFSLEARYNLWKVFRKKGRFYIKKMGSCIC